MPAVARVGVDTATDTSGTAVIIGPGATSVLVNGSPAAIIGDLIAPHQIPPPPPDNVHPADTIDSGSTTVFAEGTGVARQGDTTQTPQTPGSIDSGSPNVNAGG